MTIDVRKSKHISSKKYDYVKICFILDYYAEEMTANQINYYYNAIFSNQWCNTQRISQIAKQYRDIIRTVDPSSNPKSYYYIGKIQLHPSTQRLWKIKFDDFHNGK